MRYAKIIRLSTETLGVRLDGEGVQSVLDGDKICKFIICLPKEIMEKYI